MRFLSLIAFGFLGLALGSVQAVYRDIHQQSPLFPILQGLEERGVVDGQGFFRPDEPIPHQLFWPLVFKESDIFLDTLDPNGPALPSNIPQDLSWAPYLQAAIARGHIDNSMQLDIEKPLKYSQVITVLADLKELPVAKTTTPLFRAQVRGVSRLAHFLPALEAAYASKLLDYNDIRPFSPHAYISRGKLVLWLDRYATTGSPKSQLDQAVPTAPQTQKNTSTTPKAAPTLQLRLVPNSNSLTNRFPAMDSLDRIWEEINQRFYSAEKFSAEKKQALIDAALTALVEELDDKYSNYIPPADTADFQDGLNGEFEGIGAYVDMIDGKFTITSPIKGSPAEAAGLLPGDIVTMVDETSIEGLSQLDIVNKIRGRAGTVVKITVKRQNRSYPISVTRGKITVPPVTLKWDRGVPIVGVHQFNSTTANDFESLIKEEVMPNSPRGFVLDLRNNPGGFLQTAASFGKFFVGEGERLFSIEQKDRLQLYEAKKDGFLHDYQGEIVVLQNEGTASASEIIIGILQDYEKAQIVGTKTLGKGTVQEIVGLPDGGSLKLTIAKWLTPLNRWVHETGIAPDLEVSNPTAEERSKKVDRQIQSAVNLILDWQ